METESVKSERSNRSHKSRNSGINSHRSRHSNRNQSGNKGKMAPFQTTVNLSNDDSREGHGQEVIEVQILPQDENWGTETHITGNTSEQSISMENVNWPTNESGALACQKHFEQIIALLLCLASFFSPISMALLPKLGFFPSTFQNEELNQLTKFQLLDCNAECKGLLVTLTTRQLLLAIALWALFFRRPVAIMPRIFLFRSISLLLVLIVTFSYWLFYIFQVTESIRKAIVDGTEVANYKTLVSYAINFSDTLLFIHYVAVILLEIRHLQPLYYVKIVRSPDGLSKSYPIGQLSIQRASVWILQKYYTDFPVYNPYLERIPLSKQQRKALSTSFKYYDVDGSIQPTQQQQSQRAVLAAHARRRDSSHNERFYEEHEYERRVKKRRARLITAAEEAFTHIKRVHDQSTSNTLDPHEAAASIFPSLARALQKYLRVTRQQPRFSVESILKHLSHCLKNDLSPRAFLESYLVEMPVLQNEKERHNQSWSLICDELLSRPIFDSCVFQLVQNDVSLTVSVHKIPHFNISEKVVDPKCNKFVLRLNSETSV
ncbi:hypothetical protein ACKWTF_011276 [Chironomus riparius]